MWVGGWVKMGIKCLQNCRVIGNVQPNPISTMIYLPIEIGDGKGQTPQGMVHVVVVMILPHE